MPVALLLALSVFGVAGVVLAAIDARTHRIPDVVVLPATIAVLTLMAVAADVLAQPGRAVAVAGGALAAFGVCLVLHLARPAAFGGGDVKLAALVGATLGWFGPGAVASALFVAFAGGAAAGIAAWAAAGRRAEVAFGPVLVLGAGWSLARAAL